MNKTIEPNTEIDSVDTLLFDLDGTLLRMDIDQFTRRYFQEMVTFFEDSPIRSRLPEMIWSATQAMVSNLEARSNQSVFEEHFTEMLPAGLSYGDCLSRFERFYQEGYERTVAAIEKIPGVSAVLKKLLNKGYKLVLATNPLFPEIAILKRIAWAGIDPGIFSHITSFENSSYCKPHTAYYKEILDKVGANPLQCMMIGNDVEEDMVAGNLGLGTYLIEDQLISRGSAINCDYRGSFVQFSDFASSLPAI